MNIFCKNCGHHFTGNFCPQCGQKAKTHRITITHVLEEFWHNFTHTDKNFFSFAWILFTKPGTVIREYIEGKRTKYFNPYTYYLLVTSILIFVTKSVYNLENERYHLNNEFGLYVESNFNIIIFCTLPFLALLFKLLYANKKFNYAESFTVLIIMFALMNSFLLIVNLLYMLFIQYHFNMRGYTNLAGYILVLWALINFIKPTTISGVLKTIVLMVLFFFIIEVIGKSTALWLVGVPLKMILHSF